jgi:PAS domain S-box-containing protein
MLFRRILSACRPASRNGGNGARHGWRASFSAFAGLPLVAEAPTAVDSPLFALVAILGIIAGISIAIVYRHLHGKIEEIAARAGNAEAELRTLLTITDDAVLVLDARGVIRAANPGAEELFGRSADELCGGEISEVIPQRIALADVTRHGPASFETFATRVGEENQAVEVVLSPVELAQGRSYLVLARPRLGAMHGKPAIAEPIARHCHDLNNHLTGTLRHISMLLMKGATDSTTRERLTNAKRATLKAQETTRKMQALAKGEDAPANPPSPISATIVPMTAIPASLPSQVNGGPRVLVLDDEPAIGALVSASLEAMGYQVVTKEDGVAAVQACEEAFKSGRRFDLVISDLSLPGELDGNKAVARMRSVDPDLKAIISSGYDHDPVMLHHREHGFAGAIAKPFEMGQLARVVREVLSPEKAARKTA